MPPSTATDKRSEPRLRGAFPVRVRGIDADGRSFDTHTLADDISNGGEYLQLPIDIRPNSKLFTLSNLPSGALLFARGRVLRVDSKTCGLSGLALRFTNIRLMPRLTA